MYFHGRFLPQRQLTGRDASPASLAVVVQETGQLFFGFFRDSGDCVSDWSRHDARFHWLSEYSSCPGIF